MKPIKIFGEDLIDQKTKDQFMNCMEEDSIGVLTADAHYGYSMPVGGCIAYKNKISPSGVGYDIGCGNKAVKTNIKAADVDIANVMDEIYKRVSFGVARVNNEPVDHPVLEMIAHSPYHNMLQWVGPQLGTIGSGNHFVDLFLGEDGYLWIGVHFGSRGFGHRIASGFLAMGQGLDFDSKAKEGSMDAKPTLFDVETNIGLSYIKAMELAGAYAYAGRDIVVDKVLEILGGESTFGVHNHHNFAWEEMHFGEPYWVVRKGCTPAFPGQYGFIGANMMDTSVIIQGTDSEESKEGLYSTVHGAGRILTRTQAAGKKKWIKNAEGHKRPTIVGKGLVDFDSVKEKMSSHRIELRGAGADEAPQCYKNLLDVLVAQGVYNTIKIVELLTPIGVAMASAETFDPFKD